jgi:hypothetical protein
MFDIGVRVPTSAGLLCTRKAQLKLVLKTANP